MPTFVSPAALPGPGAAHTLVSPASGLALSSPPPCPPPVRIESSNPILFCTGGGYQSIISFQRGATPPFDNPPNGRDFLDIGSLPRERGFTKGEALPPPLELDYIKSSPSRARRGTAFHPRRAGRGQGVGLIGARPAGRRDRGWVSQSCGNPPKIPAEGFYCPARARAPAGEGQRDFPAPRGHAPAVAAGAGIWYTGGSLQRGGNGQRTARRA